MKVTNTIWHWRWKNHLQTLNEVKGEASYFPYIEELRAFDDLPRKLTSKELYQDPKPKTKYTAISMFLKDLVEQKKIQRLGSGAFRTVYGFKENPDVILKYARGGYDQAMRMNKDDFILASKYPSISPRVWAHDNEWTWVYMDAVEPAIGSFDERYYNAVRDTFPRITNYILQNVNDYLPINPESADDLMLVLSIAAAKLSRGDRRLYSSGPRDLGIKEWVARHKNAILKEADPAFIELSKAMVEYDISPSELRQGNVGFNKEGKLIIIDSSIFED